MSSPVIAIDLGTTYSCVGVWQKDDVIILKNRQGNTRTSTCVAFTKTDRLIGDAAKCQGSLNPANTIVDAKRLIGRQFDDPKIQKDITLWPFNLVNVAGKPKIQVQHRGQTQQFDAEDIISMVLRQMREIAEYNLRAKVTRAVITVPSDFSEAQRRAILDAGTEAGLEVLRIVNNPSAVALAYEHRSNIKNDINILVFDLGGGTLDVSVITIYEDGLVEVKSTAGNTYLGGEDFDSRLVQYFCNGFNRQYNKNLFNNPQAVWRLKTASERAKCILSSKIETCVQIKDFHQGQEFKAKITRARFEELCADLFESTLIPVERALKDAEMSQEAIDDVVLVGGSSRIPKIRELLQNFFGGKKLNTSMDQGETVAFGAAIQAAILSGEDQKSPAIENSLLLEVAPSSIGVEGPRNSMRNIIERNSPLPWKIHRHFTTKNDGQSKLMIKIYEGEHCSVAGNKLMGILELSGIQTAQKGVPKIELQFELDLNGFLKVSVIQPASGRAYQLTESSFDGPVDEAEAAELLSDDEPDEEEDSENEKLSARQQLNSYVLKIKETTRESKFSEAVQNQIINLCDAVLRWIDKNPDATVKDYKCQTATLTAALPRWK